MKKILGSILLGAVVLVPTAAMADGTVVISGVVAGSTSTFTDPGTVTVQSTTPVAAPAPKDLKDANKADKDERKADKKAAAEEKKADHEADKAEHELKIDDRSADNGGTTNVWQDASLVKNGGWKLS